jgi:GT2 family glycosyltransferase
VTGCDLDVAVGLVTWNSARELDDCLARLPDALDGLAAEVTVVDNGSTDASVTVARSYDGVRVIQNAENRGYAVAVNQAFESSRAPVLLALNPDAIPPPGSLRNLVERLREHPDVALVAPRLTNPDGSLQPTVHRFPSIRQAIVMGFTPPVLRRGRLGARFWLERSATAARQARSVVDIDWAVGACHVIRADAVSRRRPYREHWMMYVEDLDLCWRLRRAGWRVLLDGTVEVPHIGGASAVKAWSEAEVDARKIDTMFDWYCRRRSPIEARAWSLVNMVALLGKVAVGMVWDGAGSRRRARAMRLARDHRRLALRRRLPCVGSRPLVVAVEPPKLSTRTRG